MFHIDPCAVLIQHIATLAEQYAQGFGGVQLYTTSKHCSSAVITIGKEIPQKKKVKHEKMSVLVFFSL